MSREDYKDFSNMGELIGALWEIEEQLKRIADYLWTGYKEGDKD